MTKHLLIRILFGVSLLCLIAWWLTYSFPIVWFLFLILLYIAVIVLGSYFIELNFFTHSYCIGDSSKPQIAITFDDGPNGIYTTQVLDILKAKGVNASFFVIGKNVVENENIIQRMIEEGHIIGNHSYLHQFWFSLQSATKIVEEIKQTQEAVQAITAKKISFFRPPYGVTNPNVAKAIKTAGVKSIGWSLRSYDTVTDSPSILMNRLTKKLKNGDIVLFHDHCEATIAILPDFIDYVCSQGFEIVSLDKLIGIDAYEK